MSVDVSFLFIIYNIRRGDTYFMKDKVVLFDFDGVYKTQDFYRDHYHQ